MIATAFRRASGCEHSEHERRRPSRHPRDVHALEAVLADSRLTEASEIVVLGDTVAGSFPTECFDLLAGLGDRVRILRGNADRIVLERKLEEARWVSDRLGEDRVPAVRQWPLTFPIAVDEIGAICCCHATPRSDEEIITRLTPDADLAAALEGTEEPTVIGGHTHMQLDRRVGTWRFVNVGSVGRPYEGRSGAYWALLGPDLELVQTEYDVEAAAEAVRQSGQPRAAEVVEILLSPPGPEETAAEFEAMRGA
jgi:predicted phosphodiesterase